MNIYPARIAELHTFLEDNYGHKDRQATEILLTCLLQPRVTGRLRPWVIVETDWPRRTTADAWFSFGLGVDLARPLAVPRGMLTLRESGRAIDSWCDGYVRGDIGLFVEPNYKRADHDRRGQRAGGPMAHGSRWLNDTAYRRLMALCVRLRVADPLGPYGLKTPDEQAAVTNELGRLTRRVLDSDLRALSRPKVADNAQTRPDSLLYWSELLLKLAPLQTDWPVMTSHLSAAAHGVPVLYDDGRDIDWCHAERLLRDTIPWQTREILEAVIDYRRIPADASRGQRRIDPNVAGEIERLRSVGIVAPRRVLKPGDPGANRTDRYKLTDGDWKLLIDRREKII